MIITRTPLRISLGGGGTDLPAYYRENGAVVLTAAINRYIYVAINHTFTDDYFLKYANLERRKAVDEIEHPIIREALTLYPTGPGIEIVSLADIPSGTGLGSSGSFTVGLLRALHGYRKEHATAVRLAEDACLIEIEKLGRAVGKQDQYAAAFGGLTVLTIDTKGHVSVAPLLVGLRTIHDLEDHLVLYFTGYSRQSITILERESHSLSDDGGQMRAHLDVIAQLGSQIHSALQAGDCGAFADLMDEHWRRKRERLSSTGSGNSRIDDLYELARSNGARGGKLVGAGGGGFLLLYAEDRERLRLAMETHGLEETRVRFDHDGATVTVRD